MFIKQQIKGYFTHACLLQMTEALDVIFLFHLSLSKLIACCSITPVFCVSPEIYQLSTSVFLHNLFLPNSQISTYFYLLNVL